MYLFLTQQPRTVYKELESEFNAEEEFNQADDLEPIYNGK